MYINAAIQLKRASTLVLGPKPQLPLIVITLYKWVSYNRMLEWSALISTKWETSMDSIIFS